MQFAKFRSLLGTYEPFYVCMASSLDILIDAPATYLCFDHYSTCLVIAKAQRLYTKQFLFLYIYKPHDQIQLHVQHSYMTTYKMLYMMQQMPVRLTNFIANIIGSC